MTNDKFVYLISTSVSLNKFAIQIIACTIVYTSKQIYKLIFFITFWLKFYQYGKISHTQYYYNKHKQIYVKLFILGIKIIR